MAFLYYLIKKKHKRHNDERRTNFSDINDFSFEQASTELEQIVRTLEEGKVSLEDLLKFMNVALRLKITVTKSLMKLKPKLKNSYSKDGSAIIEPFDDVNRINMISFRPALWPL